MPEPAMLLTLQFLSWVADEPRSYVEVMDAWRTSCPRLSIWEDASLGGLVRLESGAEARTVVALTPLGRALLDGVGIAT
jgi:hypothetical protein